MRSIDLVRENPDIVYPADTQYNFVYWKHTPDRSEAAAEAVSDNDVIAIELAEFEDLNARGSQVAAARRYLKALNSVMLGTASRAETDYIKRNVDISDDPAAAIAIKLAGSRKKLYFIDAWVHADDPKHITQGDFDMATPKMLDKPSEILTKTVYKADMVKQREELAMKQLAEIGQRVSRTQAQDVLHVGVLYGAAHSLISIAMMELGAKVTRHFDMPRYNGNADEMLMKTIRATDATPETLEAMAQRIFIARLALLQYIDEVPNTKPAIVASYDNPENASIDSLLTLAQLGETSAASRTRQTLEDYLVKPKPAKDTFLERRRHNKRQTAFHDLIASTIRRAAL